MVIFNYCSEGPFAFNSLNILNPRTQRPSHIEIVVQNHSLVNSIKVDNASKIDFYNIKDGHTLKSIPVILKSPNIKVNGNTTIKHSNFDRLIEPMGALDRGIQLDVQGRLEAKIDSKQLQSTL